MELGWRGRVDKQDDTSEQVQRTALVSNIPMLVAGMVLLSLAMIGVIVRVLVMHVHRHSLHGRLCIGKPRHDPRKLRDEEEPYKPGNQPMHRPKQRHSTLGHR